MDAVLYLLVIAGLLVLGILAGGANERAHFRRLARAERELSHIRISNLKRVADPGGVRDARLVLGQVVIATDTFKTWATGLRNLVGGEMHLARRLMVRARREATVRMLREAEALGATEVWNVRYTFCSISMMRGRSGAMQVEILAFGTAVHRA